MRGLIADTRARDGAAVGLPALLAAILCAIGLTGRSLGFDEAASVAITSQHGSALWSAIARDGGNMSGFYLVLHLLIETFGNGLAVIRLVPLLSTVASVALTGLIALKLSLGRRTAFAGELLCAVSLPLVFWGQNARGYAPMVAFVCGAVLAFVSAARPGAREGDSAAGARPAPDGRPIHWAMFVVCLTCAFYSSFVAALIVPVLLVMVLHHRRLLARLVGALAAVVALCVPLVVLAVHRGSSQLFWVPRPTRKLESQVLQSMASSGQQPSLHSFWITTPLLILSLVVFLATAGLIGRRVRDRGLDPDWGAVLLVAWVMIPLVLAWLASFVIQPIFLPRNLMMAVPPVAVVLALGITEQRVPRLVSATALLVLVGLRAVPLVAAYDVSPEPWRQSTRYVLSRARPGDCIAFYPEDGRMAFQYYVGTRRGLDGAAPRSILPVARWGDDAPFVEHYATLTPAQVQSARSACPRLWFVTSHEGEPDGPAQSLANRARYLALRASLAGAFGHTPIVKFGYASAIHVQLFAPGAR